MGAKTKPLSLKEVESRVKRGIAFLDSNKKNWIKKIDLRTFNIQRYDVCVGGQVYSNYYLLAEKIEKSGKTGFELGFTPVSEPWGESKSEELYHETIQAVWVRELLKLKIKAGLIK